MNYLNVLATLPRGLKAAEAKDYVGGGTMLKELGVQPISRRKRAVIYDRHELDAAMDLMRQRRDAAAASTLPIPPRRQRMAPDVKPRKRK